MQDYRIVELTLKDLEKDLRPLDYIVQMHHGIPANGIADSWRQRVPVLQEAYKTGMYGLIVAYEKETETIVGFLDYWIINCFIEFGKIAILQNMRVIKYARGKGIGKALVKKLGDIARKRGCIEIHVVAGAGAETFYQKCGFKEKDTFLEVRIDDLTV